MTVRAGENGRAEGLIPKLAAVLALAAAGVLQFDSGFPAGFEFYFLPILWSSLHASASLRIGTWAAAAIGRELPVSTRFLLGLLLLALWPMALGAAGLLIRYGVFLPTLALGAAWRPTTVTSAIRRLGEGLTDFIRTSGGMERFVAFLLGITLLWAFFSTLVPPVGHDALAYHLGLADQYLIRGSLRPPSAGAYHLFWHQFPLTVMPLVAADRDGIAANLFGFAIFLALLCEAACWASCRAGASRTLDTLLSPDASLLLDPSQRIRPVAGMWAAAAIATAPLVLMLLAHTKDDLLAAALVLGAARMADRDAERSDRRGAILAGFLAGGALAVKPTSIFVLAPALIALSGMPWVERVIAAAAAAPLPLFWILRNFAGAGRIFAAGMLDVRGAAESGTGDAALARLHHLGVSFFSLIERFIEGPAGPVFLVMGALALLVPRRGVRLAAAAILAIGIWLAIGRGQARFLLPLWVVFAALGASEVVARGILVRGTIGLILVIQLGAGIAITERFFGFLPVQSGAVEMNAYIAKWLGTHYIQRVGALDLPTDARVITVGEHRIFPLHRYADCDGYWEQSRVLAMAHDTHDSAALLRGLREKGYTHILFVALALQEPRWTGDTPPPPCERDEEIVREMLRGCGAMMVHAETGSGLYALAERAAARP